MNEVVITLAENPTLDWSGRYSLLRAKADRRRTEIYAMDLLWLVANKYYNGLPPKPSEIESGERAPKDTRSAKQIKDDLIKRLVG